MLRRLFEKKYMLNVTGDYSEPTTPVTARVPENFYMKKIHTESEKPHISQSLRPFYSTGKNMSNDLAAAQVQRGTGGFVPSPSTGNSHYIPTSSLAHPTPQSLGALNRRNNRRPVGNMQLPGYAKYHPAQYSPQGNSAGPLSPVASRSITSQPRTARGSDAQQKLQQYRRDTLASSATHFSSMLSQGSYPELSSQPRLTPLMSPGEPMTPLQLEGQGDYMLSGSSSSANGLNGSEIEIVEQFVQRETERRVNSEARSGESSPALSPAVSPAGGCR